MTELLDFERRLTDAISALPASVRARLLQILTLSDEERAKQVGALYQDGVLPVTTDLLMDLEEEPAARALVVGVLKELEADDRR